MNDCEASKERTVQAALVVSRLYPHLSRELSLMKRVLVDNQGNVLELASADHLSKVVFNEMYSTAYPPSPPRPPKPSTYNQSTHEEAWLEIIHNYVVAEWRLMMGVLLNETRCKTRDGFEVFYEKLHLQSAEERVDKALGRLRECFADMDDEESVDEDLVKMYRSCWKLFHRCRNTVMKYLAAR